MNGILGKQRHQAGFSLVEILVAMALGLVLLGGTIAIYASSKDSYRLQENIAGMQENARFAIHALRRDIEMAGFPQVLNVAPFLAAGDTPPGDIEVSADGDSDIVTVQFQSSPPPVAGALPIDRNCLGMQIPLGNPIINQYFVENGNLRCRSSTAGGATQTQTLVENVENLQVLYGIDEDGDNIANRYVTATEVTDGVIDAGTPDWGRVVSLRLALLVASENPIDADQRVGGFSLLDAAPIAPEDDRLYRVFTTTIALRNRIP